MNTAAGIEDMLEDFQGSWGVGGGLETVTLGSLPEKDRARLLRALMSLARTLM